MLSSLFVFMLIIPFIVALLLSPVDEFKSQMMNEFEMSDMGLLHYFWALKSIKLKIEYFFHKGNMPRTFSLSLVCLIASMLLHL